MPPPHTRSRAWRVAGFAAFLISIPVSAAALTPGPAPAKAKIVHTPVVSPIFVRADKPCPDNMAHVGSSCVDRYEGSLVEITPEGREVAFSAHMPPNGKNVRAVSRAGAVPQAHISMVEAKRACKASGKRLCRAAEWKKACKGPEATRYPYGDKRVAGACNDTNRVSPMNVLHGGKRTSSTMNDPRANQVERTVERTGDVASCTNGYGVSDMVGNVHEWTDDGSFRGGYYLDTKLNGEGCDYRTTAHAPAYYDYSTGFRCCADVGSIPDES